MPDKVIYYAVVNERTSRERPAGLFRRTYTEAGGRRDEAFTRDFIWKRSSSLVSTERGDLENDFVEITEDEASQLMEQLRARWTRAADDQRQLGPRPPRCRPGRCPAPERHKGRAGTPKETPRRPRTRNHRSGRGVGDRGAEDVRIAERSRAVGLGGWLGHRSAVRSDSRHASRAGQSAAARTSFHTPTAPARVAAVYT
jgi:hypothetical protein